MGGLNFECVLVFQGPEITSLPVAAPYELLEDTEVETLLHTLTFTDVDTPIEDVICRIDSILHSDPGAFFLRHVPGSTGESVFSIYHIKPY